MLDICLVIVGIGIIIISYIVSAKLDAETGKNKTETAKVDVWSEKEEQRIRERIENIVADRMEDAMIKTDDQLSQITNEKIMAVSEFSDQILEKIKQNHTEVIFLYDLLNDKDTEIKKLLQEITEATLGAKHVVTGASEHSKEKQKKEETKAVEIKRSKKDMLEHAEEEMNAPSNGRNEDEALESVEGVGHKIAKALEESVQKSKNTESNTNKNDQILKLYNEGKSIIEIAKLLELGQGEVKLVIALFQGNKKL